MYAIRSYYGLVFEDDGEDVHLGQLVAEEAAGVGLLDAAGQRGLGAHGHAAGVGGGGAAQQAGGDDELVLSYNFV